MQPCHNLGQHCTQCFTSCSACVPVLSCMWPQLGTKWCCNRHWANAFPTVQTENWNCARWPHDGCILAMTCWQLYSTSKSACYMQYVLYWTHACLLCNIGCHMSLDPATTSSDRFQTETSHLWLTNYFLPCPLLSMVVWQTLLSWTIHVDGLYKYVVSLIWTKVACLNHGLVDAAASPWWNTVARQEHVFKSSSSGTD